MLARHPRFIRGFASVGAVAGRGGMASGETLYPGERAISGDGRLYLVMQSDGNLVLYRASDDASIWSSGTGQNGRTATMQPDGNLVVTNVNGHATFSTGTNGNPGARLALQPDGNMAIYSAGGQALWSSGTSIGPPIPGEQRASEATPAGAGTGIEPAGRGESADYPAASEGSWFSRIPTAVKVGGVVALGAGAWFMFGRRRK